MKLIVSLVMLFLVTNFVHAQLPNKVKKMEGTWEYKLGSGYEILELVGDELKGKGFRINRKTGDTASIENSNIQMINKNLIYTLTTYNVVSDSVSTTVHKFIADGKKMKFRNISSSTPYAIHFSFGFFNKNKLKMSIYHGPSADPVHLHLIRKKLE